MIMDATERDRKKAAATATIAPSAINHEGSRPAGVVVALAGFWDLICLTLAATIVRKAVARSEVGSVRGCARQDVPLPVVGSC